jgi:hypothetical protein
MKSKLKVISVCAVLSRRAFQRKAGQPPLEISRNQFQVERKQRRNASSTMIMFAQRVTRGKYRHCAEAEGRWRRRWCICLAGWIRWRRVWQTFGRDGRPVERWMSGCVFDEYSWAGRTRAILGVPRCLEDGRLEGRGPQDRPIAALVGPTQPMTAPRSRYRYFNIAIWTLQLLLQCLTLPSSSQHSIERSHTQKPACLLFSCSTCFGLSISSTVQLCPASSYRSLF